jgi:hypothetical protein
VISPPVITLSSTFSLTERDVLQLCFVELFDPLANRFVRGAREHVRVCPAFAGSHIDLTEQEPEAEEQRLERRLAIKAGAREGREAPPRR